jgi:DNA-binding response OmpR family regulator
MLNVLLVEDDDDLRYSYNMILEYAGYRVICAKNGVEALHKLKVITPSVILLDLLMPDMNGIEFLKKFNAKENSNIKVIVLSNFDNFDGVQEVLKLGAIKYVLKAHTSPLELTNTINNVLMTSSAVG